MDGWTCLTLETLKAVIEISSPTNSQHCCYCRLDIRTSSQRRIYVKHHKYSFCKCKQCHTNTESSIFAFLFWWKNVRHKSSTCDPVGSSSVLGLEYDVGQAAPLNSLSGMMGISWKTVWEWLNKEWKQQWEGNKRQHGRDIVFLNSGAGSPRLEKVTAETAEGSFQRLEGHMAWLCLDDPNM